jgi:hypothetical protein
MIAEIAAANVALGTITQALKHGKDLGDIAGTCADYFNNKAVLARSSNKRGTRTQIQHFMELEKLRKQEIKLKEVMIYQSGDPDMWNRWLLFQSECKRLRAREEVKKRVSKKNEMEEVMRYLKIFGGAMSTLVTVLLATFEGLKLLGV